jgi:hypothetical protein
MAFTAAGVLGQSQSAPTLRIVAEDGNKLPAELMYGNTKVKPLRLRPGTNTPITIADADFFVQQQYVDFLGRFPDQSGFAFWQGNISQCGANASCVEAQRVNTSAAFFLSIEFQNTGFFVYRLYKGSLGNLPRYQTFMPETRGVANGVVVGVGNWEQQLEANKQSFANSWVNRSDFLARFPASLSNAGYVDALIASAGVTAGDVNRDALVAGLGAGSETRATVLRKVVESAAFTSKETNNAFVLMQYFGYLRRDPDAAPDSDLSGYNFWLGKLNQFNGNFVQAEMVKAFLDSGEYKARF